MAKKRSAGILPFRPRRDGPELFLVHPGGPLVVRDGTDLRWWTFGGYRANATLAATLTEVVDPVPGAASPHLPQQPDLVVQSLADLA